ncbi:MAG: putative bifunctional diguanylate cyclase/phosphodiesterase [Trichloromonadaceae bacterium]
MRIKSKLLSGYFLLATLTLLLGLSAQQTIQVIRSDYDGVAGHILPHIKALENLRFAGLRLVASTAEYGFLTLSTMPPVKRATAVHEENELLTEGVEAYHTAAAQLQAIDLGLLPQEAATRQILLEAGDRLIRQSNQLIALIDARAGGTELLASKKHFELAEKDFLAAVNQALELEQEGLELRRNEVAQSIFAAKSTITLTTLLAVATALSLGLLIAAHIARPILQLQIWAERLGQGEPGLRILPRSRDEVGELAKTFNQMAIRIEAAQNQTSEARNYLAGIIRSLGDALFVLTPSGTIRSSNPASATLLGISEADLIGRPFAELLAAPADAAQLLQQILHPTAKTSIETHLRSHKGDFIPVELSSSRLESTAGEDGEVVCIAHNLSARWEAEATICQLAYFDSLTGLPNRTLLQDRLTQSLARAQRENTPLAVLYLDLDRFKDINDTLGHDNGDLFLQTVAQRLQGCIRKSDTLARIGGDEFIILLGCARDERNVAFVAEHLRALLAPPIRLGDQDLFPTSSIGIALYPHDGETAELLLKHAEMAMYSAKAKGKNAHQFFSAEMHHRAQERRDLEAKLRRALPNNEFYLVYQPQIDLRSGRIFGVEALLRWRHPVDGMISPAKFIPVAEETGLIRPIGTWVLRTACAQNQAWLAAGYPPLQMAVNFSGHQVNQGKVAALVAEILRETGLAPNYLELELTESSLMENAQETIRTLVELKALGIQLAVDDFGTGYSSLSYLKHFPIDRLKIDQSFTRDIEADPDDRGIVEAIIGLARSLNLQVIAEGVETDGALAILQRLGCDEAQGYFFAKPLEAADLLQLRSKWQPQPAPPRPISLVHS